MDKGILLGTKTLVESMCHYSNLPFRKLSLPPFMVDATITQLYLCHMLSFRNLIL